MLQVTKREQDEILRNILEGDLSKNLPARKNKNLKSFQKTLQMFIPFIHITSRSSLNLYNKITGLEKASSKLELETQTVTNTMNELAKGIQQHSDEAVSISEQMDNIHSTTETIVFKHSEIPKSSEHIQQTVQAGTAKMNESIDQLQVLKSDNSTNVRRPKRAS
ncbi:hypothetical protein [Bacillus sp. JCM 19034]|uniref:hypothetical protein n=1 Tax=Bacillus sp. JCM 19034 TaxID=1481928 RepID=UPI00078675FF|nr:hypothetical protein [Bacillus sp. JCM 19034]